MLAWLTRNRVEADVQLDESAPIAAVGIAGTQLAEAAAEDNVAEEIEDRVAELILAAGQPRAGESPADETTDTSETADPPPSIPRRRSEPLEPVFVPREPSPGERRRSALAHLAGVRQSER
jgi:hypothetical protein